MNRLLSKLQKIKSEAHKAQEVIDEVVLENKELLIEANVSQMERGEYNDGKKIAPSYAKSTIARKIAKGQPIDRVTLKDSGDFHESMDMAKAPGGWDFGSYVTYQPFLVKKYTDKIYGITQSARRFIISSRVKEKLVKLLKAA